MNIQGITISGEMAARLRSSVTPTEMKDLFEEIILQRCKTIETAPKENLSSIQDKVQAFREIQNIFLGVLDKPQQQK